VANAARNYEILHERDDEDTERPDKRKRIRLKKNKIGSKPDKNGKRGEAGKSLKQLQLKEEEKPK
nr:hypothetical protein [Tanacetum cinerariifolium]